MTLRGYRVGDVLVQDGYVVRRGARERDLAPVILKSLPPGVTDPLADAALRREADVMAGLTFEGVPQGVIFDAPSGTLAFDDGGGELLSTRLRRGALDVGDVLALGTSLASTLARIHDCGITHKSLNPHAILVDAESHQAQVFDFSVATRLAQESPEHVADVTTPDRLAFVSPEQTGRMNRSVDHRTDLYSFGAVLYAALVGRPPFDSADPLDVVHGHIARTPNAPSQVNAQIPRALSDIVMKLLSKMAEQRYQSASGVAADLEQCRRQWELTGSIVPFALARRDVSATFTIPEHLYGREAEVDRLLRTFESTLHGPTAMMLVAGYAGIGKTSLVNEIHKPILRQKGRFVAGKFDQLERSTPYGALLHALRALVRQVLAEDDGAIRLIRDRLSSALGVNASVICAVIPELERLVGAQPAPPSLGATEAQNRFNFALQGFVGAFASSDAPLVIFLDDLQWADSATLRLLPQLTATPSLRGLFLIGAYRDNEVSDDHPLQRALAETRQGGAIVERVTLRPLRAEHLQQFVADALRVAYHEAEPLAALIRRKTDGNPFFVAQFLKALHSNGLLILDRDIGRWTCDLGAVERAAITENVVDLMTRKLRDLAPQTQQALMLAACVGSTFSLQTVGTIRERPLRIVAAELWESIQAGLLIPTNERWEQYADAPETVLATIGAGFRFLHDRVQQAAYGLIPEDERKPLHLRIGRLLLAECGDDVDDARLFAVVEHLNVGGELIQDSDERLRLVRLNLVAGRRAKTSAAFRAALRHFECGVEILPVDRWETQYDLTLALTLELAECRYLCGAFAEAEDAYDGLLRRVRMPIEKAVVRRMQLVQHESQARYAEALAAGREGLALLGIQLPEGEAAKKEALARELRAIRAALATRSIATLVDLPTMADPGTKMLVSLATAMWAPAYILGDRVLASLLSARMITLSIEHGNTEESAYGYVTHAIAVGPVAGDYRSAYEWGDLALRVTDRFPDRKLRAKIHQQFNAHVALWRRPFQTSIMHAREACRCGVETGDFMYAGYGAFTESWSAMLVCRDLEGFVREFTPTVALLERLRLPTLSQAQELILNWARALQGRTVGPLSLDHGAFTEAAYLERNAANRFNLTFCFVMKLQLAVLFGETTQAREFARRARTEAWTPLGTIWPVLIDFWEGLALAASHDAEPEAERPVLCETVARAQEAMQRLADNCPENFAGFARILAGELARIHGDADSAAQAFDDAVRHGRETANLSTEALANELCARMWIAHGREAVAAAHLGEAHRCWASWRATAKVADLQRRHGKLLRPSPDESSAGATLRGLDVATALKAAHAISAEIELDRLLRTLVSIAAENAGATRGILIADRGGRLAVLAEGTGAAVALSGTPLDGRTDLAKSVVMLAMRTTECIHVDDATCDPRFLADPYLGSAGPRSILCVPIVHQGRSGGLIYLENDLAAHAFGRDRIEMMQILSAEAAIALENARLYDEMRQEVERRTRAEKALQGAVAELQRLKDRLHAENVYLQEEIRTQHNFDEIVGASPALLEALKKVEQVSQTEATVLILGETGSGKELFARAIHSRSHRSTRPLVKVNCGAIPAGLVESEIFGHVKGAFTGALQNRTGRFEVANGGTIFLDEVGELPADTQVKLLRVLQEREFEPVGGTKTVRVDVRVIAATNRNLEEAVAAGRFRADLLYRLNVFPIRVPSLRERASDIPMLVSFLIDGLSKRLGKPLSGVSRRSMERLVAYGWPGNVRELQNVIERAAILATSPVIDLGDDVLTPQRPVDGSSEGTTLEEVERRHIERTLRATRGVVEGPAGAATILGLHPNTLRSRLKKLGIDRSSHDIS